MKPGNRRNEHGANSCGDVTFLRDERGGWLLFPEHTTSSHAEGVFCIATSNTHKCKFKKFGFLNNIYR